MNLPEEIESKRLEILSQYQILDTDPEDAFDGLTHLAAYICQTPLACISLTDTNRQWFKSKIGFIAIQEPRNISFCAHTILQTELLIIQDALADERFANNPLVISEFYNIRFYAGAPLISPEGVVLGTLCVLDHLPRELSNEQQEALKILALHVVTQLELRRNLKILKQNITKHKQFEEQLLHNALHDTLTGLPNRFWFMERLKYALKRKKLSEDCVSAVLFLDLDRFKVVNDSLGHIIGDRLLIAIARRLEMCLRQEDIVARLGGDEFAILLDNIRDVSDAISIVKRIQIELISPFNLNGQEVFVSASIGIAVITTDYAQPENILRDADTAMYRAKALGNVGYAIFDRAMHDRVVMLLQLETDLRRAIERQEFQIHYQPIVSLKTGTIVGFEALVRWVHPQRGIIFPDEFVPLAEETKLIVAIDRWVLREACRQIQKWQVEFSQPLLTISVNLSSKQFSQPDLSQHIKQVLQETCLNAQSLKLEITESVLIDNFKSATATLLQIRDLGVDLYLDDFGTGYSSLSYLHHFPINVLKVDRSFISSIGKSNENSEIVRTIVTLAQNLSIGVIAEGIETVEQLTQLRTMQCEYGQGYLCSKPVDSEAVSILMAKNPQW